MNDTTTLEATNFQFKKYFEFKFARVSYHEKSGFILCELTSEYVPIDNFKETFYKISALVEAGINKKFIFDKRSLRAFHQPSMEWYFIVWKQEMLSKELKSHRKILPDEAWFKKVVEIGRNQILSSDQFKIADQLDIRYCDSIKEAIKI